MHLVLVLAGDVGLAQGHQVIDVVSGIKEEATHGTVGHLVLNKGDGTHVQAHEFLHIFHVVVERQTHLGENLRYHPLANEIVVMECPALLRIPTLGPGLAHIVQQRGPTQPHVIAGCSNIVKHLKGVHEIIFVAASVDGLNAFECCQLRENQWQQSTLVQQEPATRGLCTAHDFHQFLGNAFAGDDVDAMRVFLDGLESLVIDIEVQLCGKAYGTHHPQRVVAEGDVGVERSADDAAFHVADAIKRIQQLTVSLLVQADGHGIDSKVATLLVVVKGAVLDDGVAALAVVGLAASAYELQFPLPRLDLRCAIGAEHRQMSAATKATGHCLCHLDAAANRHKVHVVAGPLQKDVPDISTHDIAFTVQFIGHIAHQFHDRQVDVFSYFFTVNIHVFVFQGAKLVFFLRFFCSYHQKTLLLQRKTTSNRCLVAKHQF